ncbi:hypothetical protein RvY_08854 [Ramazzottius varieornatus]|uniref:Uncharacterized protein n=1 Tax=Ramazzottius varieornatus TaxID=947166 RepID=A0A1D1V9I8_RAMVA|nr:hypothetical protein RvY_08854 [Ramazzottius varieornatus]
MAKIQPDGQIYDVLPAPKSSELRKTKSQAHTCAWNILPTGGFVVMLLAIATSVEYSQRFPRLTTTSAAIKKDESVPVTAEA